VIAIGSWAAQIVVATTGGFALSVLRPRYGKVILGLLLTTLFVPTVVLLVPLYIEIVHPPLIHHSFIDSYWAIWFPAAASAFNVILMKRFFDNLPREIFEAARIDGAGPLRLFAYVVLPMSRPFLLSPSSRSARGDFRPLLSSRIPTHRSPCACPRSRLRRARRLLAAMLIACLVRSSGSSSSSAVPVGLLWARSRAEAYWRRSAEESPRSIRMARGRSTRWTS
jgi:hypothetical protein